MNLDGIRTLLAPLPWAEAAQRWTRAQQSQQVAARAGARPVLAAVAQQQATQPLLILCADRDRAHRFYQELCSWSPQAANVLFYPELDYLPYENLPHFSTTLSARVAGAGRFAGGAERQLAGRRISGSRHFRAVVVRAAAVPGGVR